MRVLPLLAVAALLLAGCSGETALDPTAGPDQPRDLASGKGGVAGLVIDDRYRPIPAAQVILFPLGLETVADALGQFTFLDLEPGAYELRVQAEGHEGAPTPVDVADGEFSEVEVEARRVFSKSGQIITNEYSVFIPCAAGFVANGVTANCLLDLSGDTYRSSFTTQLNATLGFTYLVTEMLANQAGTYSVQVREDNGSPSGGERYAVGRITDGVYIKMTNHRNETNTEHNTQRNNVNWTGEKPFATALFFEGDYAQEAQDAYDLVCQPDLPQTCRTATGAGAAFGLEARFVQSIFIGEPEVDLDGYFTMKPKE
ncbi:MAG: Carboxypeptidase regulatory-like domain [Thermoplasmata archaeon]|jgi:hypothetical protein|nr:Carboxypeptidase regulatory-like domain [Thermoplasmata archaeon]